MRHDPTRLRSLPAYRGPERTLFVFDASVGQWLVCAWDGSEALVPESDMAGFLEHCARRPATGRREPR